MSWRGPAGGGHAITVDQIVPSMRTDQFRLPLDISDFVGRADQFQRLQRLFGQPNPPPEPIVSSIVGQAGVGKTALAVRVAHKVQPSFPDGQYYVDLGGVRQQPLDPDEVLGEILLELGLARKEIPEELDERTDAYRAQLAQRKVLLVLDNASRKEQVEPLLPGSAGSAALITSRTQLDGLGVTPLVLDVLDEPQAVALLARGVGRLRVEAEPEAAREIVRLCGHLPLAIRIAGARLAGSRQTSLAAFAARLADEQVRQSELRLEDHLEVRASFALNYESLREDERRLFRRLSVVEAPDFAAWVAAALLGCDLAVAQELIRRLVKAEVLDVARETSAGQLRYRFHDLLRVLARDRRVSEELAESQAALDRLLVVSRDLAAHAAALFEPGGRPAAPSRSLPAGLDRAVEELAASPGGWFDDERVGLLAAIEQAFARGHLELTWELAGALAYFLNVRTHWTDWQHSQQRALDAARLAGDERAMANARRNLGEVLNQLGQRRLALPHFEEALKLYERHGDRRGRGWTLVGFGSTLHEMGSYAGAAARFQEARDLLGGLGNDRRGEAWALEWLGVVRRYQGRAEEAQAHFQDALARFERVGDRKGEAYCLINLGALHRDRHEFQEALAKLEAARPIFDELDDQHGAASLLLNEGHILREQGRLEEAVEVLDSCVRAMRMLGDRMSEAYAHYNLGRAFLAQGRHDKAMEELGEAGRLFEAIDDDRGRAWTSIAVGSVQLDREPAEAVASFRRALDELPTTEGEVWRARALSGLGLALAACGEPEEAVAPRREALDIFLRLGAPEAREIEQWLAERR